MAYLRPSRSSTLRYMGTEEAKATATVRPPASARPSLQ